jgi:hypothetical protein
MPDVLFKTLYANSDHSAYECGVCSAVLTFTEEQDSAEGVLEHAQTHYGEIKETRRAITSTESLHTCGTCGEPAAQSCTDARQIGDAWEESAPRFGCLLHPVQPMIYFANGRAITAAEYERGNV